MLDEYATRKGIIETGNFLCIGVSYEQALKAMQSYSDQQNAGLLAWKESALREINALDLQSLGRKLGIGLGQSVSENVHSKVDGLLERVKELETENERLRKISKGYEILYEQNESLREQIKEL